MLDYIFAENYEIDMENLKSKISAKTYNDLESFFINTNLDSKQRVKLIKIISKVFTDGEASGIHNNLNTKEVTGDSKPKSNDRGPRSWEY
jgi:uncharacterized tellurite resistance protein B-like protein